MTELQSAIETQKQNRNVEQGESEPKPVFDARQILADVSSSVLKISTNKDKQGEWQVGSGFFVSSGGPSSCELATVNHVTNGDKTIKVTTNDGKTYDGKVVKIDWKHEIAIYKLSGVENPEATCKPLSLNTRTPNAGEFVLAVSAVADPRWPTPYIGQSLGQVDRYNPTYIRFMPTLIREDMLRPMEAFVMRGDSGDSGGPIVDSKGKVVGLEAAASNGYSVSELARFLQDTLDDVKADREIRRQQFNNKI